MSENTFEKLMNTFEFCHALQGGWFWSRSGHAHSDKITWTTFLDASPSSSSVFFLTAHATLAKYMITFLVFSVLPAPDSPLLYEITLG